MKKKVGYSFIVFGLLKSAFLLYERLSGHYIPIVEDASYILLLIIGGVIIFTDIHIPLSRLNEMFYNRVELGFFDAINYWIADAVMSFSNSFRKTHTGNLNLNILAIQFGGLVLLAFFLIFGEYI